MLVKCQKEVNYHWFSCDSGAIPRERACLGAFGKIDCRSFLRLIPSSSPYFLRSHPVCFLRVSLFSHSDPVSFPSHKFLETLATQAITDIEKKSFYVDTLYGTERGSSLWNRTSLLKMI